MPTPVLPPVRTAPTDPTDLTIHTATALTRKGLVKPVFTDLELKRESEARMIRRQDEFHAAICRHCGVSIHLDPSNTGMDYEGEWDVVWEKTVPGTRTSVWTHKVCGPAGD